MFRLCKMIRFIIMNENVFVLIINVYFVDDLVKWD